MEQHNSGIFFHFLVLALFLTNCRRGFLDRFDPRRKNEGGLVCFPGRVFIKITRKVLLALVLITRKFSINVLQFQIAVLCNNAAVWHVSGIKVDNFKCMLFAIANCKTDKKMLGE